MEHISQSIIYIFIFISLAVIFLIERWIHPYFFINIETSEIDKYYNFLVSQNNNLRKFVILKLGVKNSKDFDILLQKLKNIMGLDYCNISLLFHNADTPPGFMRSLGFYNYEISLSRKLENKHEAIATLIHELSHIYISNMHLPFLSDKDKLEKMVDCLSVLLGFGVFVLNAVTDEAFFIPGYVYEAKKRLFGYLTPEQFGYLFVRHLKEGGCRIENVTPFLNDGGHRYFKIGFNYLKRRNKENVKIYSLYGLHGCFKCESLLRFPLDRKIRNIKCKKCDNEYKIAGSS